MYVLGHSGAIKAVIKALSHGSRSSSSFRL